MKLSGLHLLLTYSCNLECEHCFAWGSPWQQGTMNLANVQEILRQAGDLGGVDWIYFEGGEPFLYYAILLGGVQMATDLGFQVGLVSNGYWATCVEDGIEWLKPLAGSVHDLSISSDRYHGREEMRGRAENACQAGEELGIPVGMIRIAQPEATNVTPGTGQLPVGESAVMYRGRAADKLTEQAERKPWSQFTECPCEDLRQPGRVHVDPPGNVHICQGISLGNLFRTPLKEICDTYDPDSHPIIGTLLRGGPAELRRQYGPTDAESYADACHLCYEVRRTIRPRFPGLLAPDQMYGLPDSR